MSAIDGADVARFLPGVSLEEQMDIAKEHLSELVTDHVSGIGIAVAS